MGRCILKNFVISDKVKKLICEDCLNTSLTRKQIAKKYGVGLTTISRALAKNKASSKKYIKKYCFDEHYFDSIDTEEKSYFLGLLYADGYNSGRYIELCLQEKDRKILEIFNFYMKSTVPIHLIKSKHKNHQNQYSLKFCSRYLSSKLTELGCHNNKSLTLRFPNNKQVPTDLLKHFIRGYFDGDGCFGEYRRGEYFDNVISIISTKDFCKSISCFIMEKIETNFSFKSRSLNGITTEIRLNKKKEILNFLNWIYENSSIYLDRKYNKYRTSNLYVEHFAR